MFDRIAGVYDLMNTAMTAGMHHRWRERAADRAELSPGDAALDLCCGTGDLALELARRVGAGGRVVGCDFSERMLELARRKAGERGASQARFEWADALELPYAEGSFDAVTVGFGVRNLVDLERGLAEMARVLKPGGRAVILEITQPRRRPLSTFYSLWFDRLVPLLGTLAGDRDAYTYLPESVRRFPSPEGLAAMMAGVRLERIRYLLLAGGIIAIHSGVKEGMNRTAVPPPVTLVLEAADAWLPARMEAVEERLGRLVEGHGEALAADAGATLAAGGKRLRPMLVLLSAGPRGAEAAIRAATAIELVHMATLVHDDVLDAAPLRRGHPTVLARSGRGRALAVGDLLFSRAFGDLVEGGSRQQVELLSQGLGGAGARRAGSAARRLRRLDLRRAIPGALRAEDGSPVRVRLRDRAARRLRARRGPERRPRAALEVFGREIGLAFQLLDDVLDVTGPPERTGKARGTDLLDGTVTLPLILARERDQRLAELEPARARRRGRGGGLRPDRGDGRPRPGEGRRPQARGARQARPGALRARPRSATAARAGRRRRRRAVLRGPRSLRGGCGPRSGRGRSGRCGPPCSPG